MEGEIVLTLYQKRRQFRQDGRFREDYATKEERIQQEIIAARCEMFAREIRSRREKK
jgi:hypothetical protein